MIFHKTFIKTDMVYTTNTKHPAVLAELICRNLEESGAGQEEGFNLPPNSLWWRSNPFDKASLTISIRD